MSDVVVRLKIYQDHFEVVELHHLCVIISIEGQYANE